MRLHISCMGKIPLPTAPSDDSAQQTVLFATAQVFSTPLLQQSFHMFFQRQHNEPIKYFSHTTDVQPHFSDVVLM